MIRIVLFVLLQFAVSFFAIRRGGAPERVVGWMLLVAEFLNLVGGVPAGGFRIVAQSQFFADVALFGGLLIVALRANRFWPIWLAALQLIAIGVHGVRAIDGFLVPYAYYKSLEKIAYPMCLALAVGTYHYLRRGRIEGQAPAAWAPLRW